ncbi:MAG: hypothetical protein H6578_10075 [Chitinophagales bacterium]|nr:hypothetical protein [Chitinophagales bacterium]
MNLSLTEPSKNILYVGVSNHLKLEGVENCDSLQIQSNHCTFNKIKNEEYSYDVKANSFSIDTVKLYCSGKFIDEFVFELARIEYFVCQLGNIDTCCATIEQILELPKLNLIFNDYLKHNMRILFFEVYVSSEIDGIYKMYEPLKEGTMDTITMIDPITLEIQEKITGRTEAITVNYADRLTDYQINEIKKLNKGDLLIFDNIKVQSPDSKLRKIPSITIRII